MSGIGAPHLAGGPGVYNSELCPNFILPPSALREGQSQSLGVMSIVHSHVLLGCFHILGEVGEEWQLDLRQLLYGKLMRQADADNRKLAGKRKSIKDSLERISKNPEKLEQLGNLG